MVRVGDVVQVRKPPVTYSFRILALAQNRMGAKLVKDFLENITPPEEYEILEMQRISGFVDRAKGTGRPTKKDRRELEQFSEEMPDLPHSFDSFDWDEEDFAED